MPKTEKNKSKSTNNKSKHYKKELRALEKKAKKNLHVPFNFSEYDGSEYLLTDARDVDEVVEAMVNERRKMMQMQQEQMVEQAALAAGSGGAGGGRRVGITAMKSGGVAGMPLSSSSGATHQHHASAVDPARLEIDLKRLHISNVHFEATEDEVKTAFAPHAEVKRVTFSRPDSEGAAKGFTNRGFCFVDFADTETAKRVNDLPHGTVSLRGLSVKTAIPNSAASSSGGGTSATTASAAAASSSSSGTTTTTSGGDTSLTAPRVAAILNLVESGGEVGRDIIDAVRDECSKHGPVVHIQFYRDNTQGNIIVAAVEFVDTESAMKCVSVMNGKTFDGRMLRSGLMDMKAYLAMKQH